MNQESATEFRFAVNWLLELLDKGSITHAQFQAYDQILVNGFGIDMVQYDELLGI